MSTAPYAYAIIFFLALARYNATSIGSNCQESGCQAGLHCVDDANNELCNKNNNGLIVACDADRWQPTDNNVYSVPIAQNGTPSEDPIWSYRFNKSVDYVSVDVDNVLQQAYIYDTRSQTIQKNPNYNFGPSTENIWTTLHKGISDDSLKLAVDWISHNIYWTDPSFKWIMVQSLLDNDTSMYRVLMHENLERPLALVLDPSEALLFWSDIGKVPKIEVSTSSGRNRRTLLCSNLLHPYSLAADNENRQLYFVDINRLTMESITYDGNDRKILLERAITAFDDIAVYKDFLYVTGGYQLSVINKTNGNEFKMTIGGNTDFCYGVAVFHHDIQPSSVSAHCVNYGCEHICLTEKDGAMCICKDGYNLNQDMKTCSLCNEYFHRALVYSNASSICVMDIRVLSNIVFDPVCVLKANDTKYMVMDTDRRQIFIGNDTAIFWAMVDNPELHLLTEAYGIISGMAWDGYDRNLYWTVKETGKIWRISIESGHVEVFLEGFSNPRDILILPHDRLVFWISDRNGSIIESSNINGSNIHVFLNYDDEWDWKSLSYDEYNKRIFIIAASTEDYEAVFLYNLDGSKGNTIYFFYEKLKRIELYKGYLLVTSEHPNGTLIRSYDMYDDMDINPSGFVVAEDILDIKIFDENNRQNETGPCDKLNGECEQICIANGMSRICKCTFGFRLAGDGKTCISDPIKDNFMLVGDVTHRNIYQISMNDQSVQGLKAKGVDPMYDPMHELLLWRPGYGVKIFSMHLNGTGRKQFPVPRPISAFDVDYSTGNIYYASKNTTEYVYYISVLSPDGKNLDLIKGLNYIQGLVVYPSEGYMFYLHSGELVRVNMDGSLSEILFDGLKGSIGLTIDYSNGYLYWIETSGNSKGYSIKKCKPDGTNNSTLFEFEEQNLNKYSPSSLAVYKEYLFIALNKQSRLIKLNISNPNEMTEFSIDGALGKIGKVKIYSSATQNKNAFCSDRNGGCSTFCLPVPGGGKCSCEDDVDYTEGIPSVTDGL